MSHLAVYSLLINFSDFRIQLGLWIRIREGKNDTQHKKTQWRNSMFQSAEYFPFGAGVFSCSLKGLHRTLDKFIAVFFLSKMLNFLLCNLATKLCVLSGSGFWTRNTAYLLLTIVFQATMGVNPRRIWPRQRLVVSSQKLRLFLPSKSIFFVFS